VQSFIDALARLMVEGGKRLLTVEDVKKTVKEK